MKAFQGTTTVRRIWNTVNPLNFRVLFEIRLNEIPYFMKEFTHFQASMSGSGFECRTSAD